MSQQCRFDTCARTRILTCMRNSRSKEKHFST